MPVQQQQDGPWTSQSSPALEQARALLQRQLGSASGVMPRLSLLLSAMLKVGPVSPQTGWTCHQPSSLAQMGHAYMVVLFTVDPVQAPLTRQLAVGRLEALMA